jgi:hypothetical protein
MRRINLYLGATMLVAAVAWAATDGGAESPLQQALDELLAGHNPQAERLALAAAIDNPRAWLVVASARRGQGDLDGARDAYSEFLAKYPGGELRPYALDQYAACRQRPAHRPPAPPSESLNEETRRELAEVDRQTYTESSTHFLIKARNLRLAKLLVVEAERALARASGLVAGREYPHVIELNVWADQSEYKAHARHSPEWSGGSSLIARGDNGTMIRRVDLTQLDSAGQFALRMLDSVLPHELCHLVLKDHFGDAPMPLFLNEGLAMAAEWRVDNSRVLLAGTALAGKAKISLDDLVSQQKLSIDVDVFYAEAYSLVAYLRTRMSDEQFKRVLRFVKQGCTLGDAIHRALYLPNNPALLEEIARGWEDDAIAQAQMLRTLQAAH